jgi:hypothetical protein
MQNPSEHLEKYSLAADPFVLLQEGCGISLFIIVPFALALGLFAFFMWVIQKALFLAGVKVGRIKETGIILGIILILFLGLNVRLKAKSRMSDDRLKLWQLAKGEEPGDRIGALQRLDEILEPQSCQAHQEDILFLTRDQNPVVRRFGASLLGKLTGMTDMAGGGPTGPAGQTSYNETGVFPLLLSLLDDSNINVVYTAAESLGKMRNQKARDVLLGILQSNRPWYLKMKVYHALKDNMGWINEPKP